MQTTQFAAVRTKDDWASIRMAYEANDASIRAIAREHGLSDTAVRKRAQAEGWERAGRPDRLDRGVLSPGCMESSPAITASKDLSPSLAAVATADPKAIVAQGRDIVARLFGELSAATTYLGEIEELIDEETRDDKDGRRRYAMMKAVNLATRAAVAKNLAAAAKTLADAAPTGGKKLEARDRAANVGRTGRFATPATPLKLVANNRP